MNCVLFENGRFAVLVKKAGEDSEGPGEGLLCVHRLDRPAGGLIVCAKDSAAAAELSAAFSGRKTKKEYLAVVCGIPAKEGRMEDLLFHDRRTNKTYIAKSVRKGVKKASLSYETLCTAENEGKAFSLVRIRLETGRTHQIRVQFASRHLPLAGDGRYGSTLRNCPLALWSHFLSFPSPGTGETVSFRLVPDVSVFPWSLFGEQLESLR